MLLDYTWLRHIDRRVSIITDRIARFQARHDERLGVDAYRVELYAARDELARWMVRRRDAERGQLSLAYLTWLPAALWRRVICVHAWMHDPITRWCSKCQTVWTPNFFTCKHVWIEAGPGEHKCSNCPAMRSDFGL